MALKTFTIDFRQLATKKSLRGDFRFSYFNTKKLPYKYTPFKNFITKIRNGKDIAKENYVAVEDSKIIYPTVNNIKSTGMILDKVTAIDNEFVGGYYIDDNDIVITRSGTVGLTKCWNKTEINSYLGKNVESIPSGYLIVSKVNLKTINPNFIEHFLNSSMMSEYFTVFGVGKSQKNIAQGDINYLPFPLITKSTQDQIVAKIEPIEKIINELKTQIKTPQKVINEVFARTFGFDLQSFEDLAHISHFFLGLTKISASKDLRSAVKFNSAKYDFLNSNQFKKNRFIDIIDINNTSLGRQITPSSIIEESDYYYVNAKSLKNFVFDEFAITPIDLEFFSKNKHIMVEKNNILLVASGEGSIGKSAIFNSDLNCITSQFVMKIAFRKNVNIEYVHYYMQSLFFQLTVEKFKKGMGNMTNIFASQLKNFPILLSENSQQKMVDEIKTELDKQDEIKHKINSERRKIDKIIENSIK